MKCDTDTFLNFDSPTEKQVYFCNQWGKKMLSRQFHNSFCGFFLTQIRCCHPKESASCVVIQQRTATTGATSKTRHQDENVPKYLKNFSCQTETLSEIIFSEQKKCLFNFQNGRRDANPKFHVFCQLAELTSLMLSEKLNGEKRKHQKVDLYLFVRTGRLASKLSDNLL